MQRYSLDKYYKKIAEIYKNQDIRNTKLILKSISNEPLEEQIKILKAIKLHLLKDLTVIKKYNFILKTMEKDYINTFEAKSWDQITRNYSYYIRYYKKNNYYYRNIAIMSLHLMLVNDITSQDILKLKLSRDPNDIEDHKLKVINNESSFINLDNGRVLELTDDLHKILFKYIVHNEIEDGQPLFKFIQNRIVSILCTFLKANFTQIKEAYRTINEERDDPEEDDIINNLIIRFN